MRSSTNPWLRVLLMSVVATLSFVTSQLSSLGDAGASTSATWTDTTLFHSISLNDNADAVAVSCATSEFCVVGGDYTDANGERQAAVTITNGTTWTTSTLMGTYNISGNAHVNAVSCVSSSFCVAGGFYDDNNSVYQAFVSVYNGSSWTQTPLIENLNDTDAAVKSISCTSSTFCVAGGFFTGNGTRQPFVSVYNGSTWSSQAILSGYTFDGSEVNAVSCASSTFCMALSTYSILNDFNYSVVSTYDGTSWSDQAVGRTLGVNGASELLSLSCVSSTFCVAGGSFPESNSGRGAMVSNFNGSTWSDTDVSRSLSGSFQFGGIYSVSCFSATACIAGGNFIGGDLVSSFDGVTWTSTEVAASNPFGIGIIQATSCFSATFCVASGSYVDENYTSHALASIFNGTSWTDSEMGTSLNAVNGGAYSDGIVCTSTSTCLAVGSYNSISAFASTLNVTTTSTTADAPTSVVAEASSLQATISWTAPLSDGGSSITSYVVTSSPGGKTCTWTSGPLTCTVTGLTNGTSYTFTVVAHNGEGDSLSSQASSPVTPVGIPTSPGVPTLTNHFGSIGLTWAPPLDNGGEIVTYSVEERMNRGSWRVIASGLLQPSYTFIGSTPGNTYLFAVKATNSAGSSSWSACSYLYASAQKPTIPQLPRTTARHGIIQVTWSQPQTLGETPVTYTVRVKTNDGAWRTLAMGLRTRSLLLSNTWFNSTYTFSIAAVNSAGTSPWAITAPRRAI